MKILFAAGLGCVAGLPLPGRTQIVVTGKCQTKVAVSSPYRTASLPHETPIAPQISLDASSAAWGVHVNYLSAQVTATGAKISAAASVGAQVLATSSASLCDGSRSPAGLSFRLASSAGLAPGHLVAVLDGSVRTLGSNASATASATLKVGARSFAWSPATGPITARVPVFLTPAGFAVEVRLQAASRSAPSGGPSAAGHRLNISFDFAPAESAAVPYGSSCATLQGSFPSPRSLRLQVSNGVRNGVGVSLLGVQRIQVPVPWPRCVLLVTPLLVIGHYRTDGAGAATHSIPLPPGSLDFYLQDFLLRGSGPSLQVKLTSGLEVHCR